MQRFHGVSVRTTPETDERLALLAAKLEGSRGYAAAIAMLVGLDALERGYPVPEGAPTPRKHRPPRRSTPRSKAAKKGGA